MSDRVVKLVVPTDFEILAVLSEGQRQTAPNLAAILDKESTYMNNRLAALAAKGLVEKVGPAERSGMYEITELGRAALAHREDYSHEEAQAFRALIEAEVDGDDA